MRIYDALEKIHQQPLWHDKNLSTEEFIQTISESELNSKIKSNLKTNQKSKEGSVVLQCVVGGNECLYRDK